MQTIEHISEQTIERYRARLSPPAEFLSVQSHVGECADCRARLAQAVDASGLGTGLRPEALSDLFGFDGEPEHVPGEQLTLYVDGKLDEVEREIADSHLAVCRECAADLIDLRRYQTLLVAAEAAPVNAPVVETVSVGASEIERAPMQFRERQRGWPESRSLWQRLLSFDFLPSFGAFMPAGVAVAAVLAVLLLGVWLAMRTGEQPDSKMARVEPGKQPAAIASNENAAPTPTVSNAQNDSSISTPNANSPSGVQVPSTSTPDSPRVPQPGARKPHAPDVGTPADAELLVALNDAGGRIALGAQGNVRGLESLSPSAQQAVRQSLQTQRADTPRTLGALAGANNGVLMSGSATTPNEGVPFSFISPVGKVVRDSQPTLRWRPFAGATSYTVAVVDANFRVVAQSEQLSATEWTPPKSLPRGANYSWQVTALHPDGTEVVSPVAPAPQAKFRVLEQSALDDITQLETSGVQSHLARGVLYARAGLLNEAATEFESLVKANPRSPLARKLLNSVRRRKAQTKEWP